MQFLQKSDYVWINGDFVPWEEAKIHIMTHALHYSSAVFEGIRSYDSKIFEAELHAKRLIDSAKMLEMTINYDIKQIVNFLYETIEINRLSDSYIRPLIWRGDEEMKIYSDKITTNFLIAAWPMLSNKINSVDIDISRWRKFSPDSFPTNCKASATYSMMTKIQVESLKKGFTDSLLLDVNGNIAECTCSNIFFVGCGVLYTPKTGHILNGITRQTVISIAQSLGIEVLECDINPQNLSSFDECFITGTAVEIKPIRSITYNDNKISFKEDNITGIIIKKYQELVKKK